MGCIAKLAVKRQKRHARLMKPADSKITHMLALNAAHEVKTSALSRPALEGSLAQAFFWAAPNEGRDALLIALDQDAAYDNANFAWFAARHPRFVYIDRVIVAAHARGRGLARRLYGELMVAMRAAGQNLLVCEVNLCPPNPASLAMHRALGFATVGEARLANGKTVAYQALTVPAE